MGTASEESLVLTYTLSTSPLTFDFETSRGRKGSSKVKVRRSTSLLLPSLLFSFEETYVRFLKFQQRLALKEPNASRSRASIRIRRIFAVSANDSKRSIHRSFNL